jgi:hypothetical protein
MSTKATETVLKEDFDHTIMMLAGVRGEAQRAQGIYEAALKSEREYQALAERQHRASLILAGADLDGVALRDTQVRQHINHCIEKVNGA